ncbi:MAG: DNA-binding domain-containing protein [Proteobacteria bacterium]|nr:DNA-binding domain-containing protein [Pseudomonadota bacterium]
MSLNASLQSRFRQALLDPETAVPPEVTSWNGSDPAQRFAVYRNNVTVSLIEALGATFPTVKAMVGEDFFRDMARVYLRAHPPSSPMMVRFGESFPDFLAGFAPVATLAYLPDLARLEAARRRAFHAADAASLSPEDFASLDPAALPGLVVTLHPSLQVFSARHAAVSLWAAHQGQGALEAVDPHVPEEALILRPIYEVDIVPLPLGGASFFDDLRAGYPLGEAATRLAPEAAAHLPLLINTLVQSGVTISYAIQKDTGP